MNIEEMRAVLTFIYNQLDHGLDDTMKTHKCK